MHPYIQNPEAFVPSGTFLEMDLKEEEEERHNLPLTTVENRNQLAPHLGNWVE
jgi:hypothetical protein